MNRHAGETLVVPPLDLERAHHTLDQPADQTGGWVEYRVNTTAQRWEVRPWGEHEWRAVW